ncbi:Lanosterol synthase (Oxidosqualene--lanosterol cyclase) [Quaeritorhiza haematococci]|nr:Lanosterol synthase (Oxidosqualene--lanosterol cyclase) [Quaeritorhiza haematococci]
MGIKPHFSTDDLDRWRLSFDKDGNQVWSYLSNENQLKQAPPQNATEKYWLGVLKDARTLDKATTPREAARNGFRFFKELQAPDGHWAGEYGGPMFLIPGYVITMYITNTEYPTGYKKELIRYLKNRAHPEDGGWGLHIEGVSTVFGTALNYVALRLLGCDAEDPVLVKARGTLHKLGGATGIPAWGKFWLSVLNVYSWEGVNPIPPELWLLPNWVPFHPWRWWIHTRAVYLPMGYVYGLRFQALETKLIEQLRQELYVTPYEEINWPQQRNNVSPVDLAEPHSRILDILHSVLGMYESFLSFKWLRCKALDLALEHIRAEDSNTDYSDLAPVSKQIQMLVRWIVDGPKSEAFGRHVERNKEYLWMANDGMRMNGTNGSQVWDTCFSCQCLIDTELANEPEFQGTLLSALHFVDNSQIRHDMPNLEKCYRFNSKGAWPFSTKSNTYTLSDCTADGLKTVVYCQNKLSYTPKLVSDERLFDAVNILLMMQNPDGGFASYEPIRGPQILEWLNPAEVFGKIMIEYNYPECTTSVVLGLSAFKKYFPDHRRDEIDLTIARAIRYIKNAQRPDGSWYGSWGICFTYAMFFALESLATVGETYENSDVVRRACDFLISKQMADGGWGESYRACETEEWVDNPNGSQVVNTSWALLGLMAAKYPHEEHLRKGVKVIMQRQQPTGEWLQESIEGVFNKFCMISYPNYKFYFCIWALGRYAKIHGDKKIL